MRILHFEEVSSTNDIVKEYLAAREDVIAVARRQSAGRGTKGRTFLSSEGGVYLSALTFYEDLPASRAFEVMAHAAVAVCRAAERFGVAPKIKWANDVVVGNKKLAGILIENAVSGGKLDHSIVGIGVNSENDLSALCSIAISLSEAAGRRIAADEAAAALIEEYQRKSAFSEYLARLAYVGERVIVTEGEEAFPATFLGVLPDGRARIRTQREERALSAAEISIRPQEEI